MSESARMKAEEVFSTICKTFDGIGWKYTPDEENLILRCGFIGEDLPMDFYIRVKPEISSVILLSELPFRVPEEKRLSMAVAVCAVNDVIIDGCFDFDITDGQLVFRMNNSYMDCEPTEEVFRYMMGYSGGVVDAYNDKFLMLIKDLTTVEKFLAQIYHLEEN